MFACPGCGASLKYDIASGKLSCEYCRKKYAIGARVSETRTSAYVKTVRKNDDGSGDLSEVTVFTCPQCGAELYSEDNSATSYCVYCGTDNVLTQRIEGMKRPKRIVPFTKGKEECSAALRAYLKAYPFASKKLGNDVIFEHMRPVYVPYLNCTERYEGELLGTGRRKYRTDELIVTDTFNVQADIDAKVSNIRFDGSSVFDDALSGEIEPFPQEEVKDFRSEYLAGFYAEVSDVGDCVYKENAALIAREKLREAVGEKLNMKITPEDQPREEHEVEQEMMPVWFTSMRMGDRIAYAVVNGTTGKAYCDVPVSLAKYFLIMLAAALPVFVFLNIKFTFLPAEVLKIAAVGACLTGILSAFFRSRVKRREERIDDRGYRSGLGALPLVEAPDARLSAAERKELDRERKDRLHNWRSGRGRESEKKDLETELNRSKWRTVVMLIGSSMAFVFLLLLEEETGIISTLAGIEWLSTALLGIIGVFASLFFHTYRTDRRGREYAGVRVGRAKVPEGESRIRIRFPGLMSVLGALLMFGTALLLRIAPGDRIFYHSAAAVLLFYALASVVASVIQYNALFTRPVPFLKREKRDQEQKTDRKKGPGLLRPLLVFLVAAGLLLAPAANADASGDPGVQPERQTGEIAEGFERIDGAYIYSGPYNTHAIVDDRASVLTFGEQQRICEQIRKITKLEGGNIGFISVGSPEEVEEYLHQYAYAETPFGFCSGTVAIFDVSSQNLTIHSRGGNMEVIDERYIRSITDNVSPLIKKRQYYAFVEETMREFGMILSGKPIPQPVKHFDNAMLSLILSGLLVFAAILISAKFRKRGKKNILKDVRITCRMSNAKTDLVGRTGRLP